MSALGPGPRSAAPGILWRAHLLAFGVCFPALARRLTRSVSASRQGVAVSDCTNGARSGSWLWVFASVAVLVTVAVG